MQRQLVLEVKELLAEKVKHLEDIIDKNQQICDQRFEALDETTHIAMMASEKAISKAEVATEKRFEGVNEFRLALSDQTNTFMTRKEFDAKWEGMEKNRKDQTSLVFAILSLVISILGLIIKFI